MTTNLPATSSGTGKGFETHVAANDDKLQHPQGENKILLKREDPFGVTAIIGGTNVRFCISYPDSPEPLSKSFKWEELKAELAPLLKETGTDFGDAHRFAMPLIAKKCMDFIADHYAGEEPPPFDKMTAFNFSVAGVVQGQGIDAQVSTTNTGLKFSNESIALSMLTALQTEAIFREWPKIPVDNVAVINDAAAGVYGEVIAGGLQGVQHGLFVILGTGVGSMGWSNGKLNHDFNELGHRIIFNSADNRSTFLEGDRLKELITKDGSFTDRGSKQRYAENQLAGPWLAIRFAKGQQEKATMDELAEQVFKVWKEKFERESKNPWVEIAKLIADVCKDKEDKLPDVNELAKAIEKNPEMIIDAILIKLDRLANLSSMTRTRWAANSDSAVIDAVNRFILKPNLVEFFKSDPEKIDLEAAKQTNPKKALRILGALEWKAYFDALGEFLGKAYAAMKAQGTAPEKIILGGGIGEACNKYAPDLRQIALERIHEAAQLEPGVIEFSTISAEMRETAITQRSVSDAVAERFRNAKPPTLS